MESRVNVMTLAPVPGAARQAAKGRQWFEAADGTTWVYDDATGLSHERAVLVPISPPNLIADHG